MSHFTPEALDEAEARIKAAREETHAKANLPAENADAVSRALVLVSLAVCDLIFYGLLALVEYYRAQNRAAAVAVAAGAPAATAVIPAPNPAASPLRAASRRAPRAAVNPPHGAQACAPAATLPPRSHAAALSPQGANQVAAFHPPARAPSVLPFPIIRHAPPPPRTFSITQFPCPPFMEWPAPLLHSDRVGNRRAI